MLSRTSLRRVPRVSMIMARRTYVEGDAGAPRAQQSGDDAFRQREAANENYYIRQHEAEKLAKLKKDLEKAKEEVTKLDNEIKSNEAKANGNK